MKEVDRVIANLEAQIEALEATKKLLVASKVTVAHAKPRTPRAPRVPKEAA